jgi:hypothetical protein
MREQPRDGGPAPKLGHPAPGHGARPKAGRCGGTNRQGGPCGNAAGYKTATPGYGNCAFHGGATLSGRQFAARLAAEDAAEHLGVPVATTPDQALQDALDQVNGFLAWVWAQLRALDPGERLWNAIQRRVHASQTGVAGGAGQPTSIDVDQALRAHPLFGLMERAEERRAKIAAEMIRLGIEPKREALVQRDGAEISARFQGILADLRQAGWLVAGHWDEIGAIIARNLRGDGQPEADDARGAEIEGGDGC